MAVAKVVLTGMDFIPGVNTAGRLPSTRMKRNRSLRAGPLDDTGVVINPAWSKSNCTGVVVQGAGLSFAEKVIYDPETVVKKATCDPISNRVFDAGTVITSTHWTAGKRAVGLVRSFASQTRENQRDYRCNNSGCSHGRAFGSTSEKSPVSPACPIASHACRETSSM